MDGEGGECSVRKGGRKKCYWSGSGGADGVLMDSCCFPEV